MTILIGYLLVGAVAGLLAGLFGVGGGAIIVPILIFLFGLQSFPPETLVHLALGTSFATIIFTSLSSIIAHHRLGNVNWGVARMMTPGLALGVTVGSVIAATLSGTVLQIAIGTYLCVIAIQFVFALQPRSIQQLPGCGGLSAAGTFIGGLSAFFGIAGGSMTVPFLTMCKVEMKRAVATSAVCGLPIALFGAITYSLEGVITQQPMPEMTIGYIYWPAVIGIVLVSTPFARVGAAIANRLQERNLKRAFALVMLLIGVRLLVTA